MTRRTRLAIILVAAVLVVSMAGPAWAKGSYLYFDRLYVAPGEQVVLETEFYTNVSGKTGSVEAGPYYAYLLPERRTIDPPRIPKVAVFLGPIQISPGDRDVVWSASVAFTMPQVNPGRYRVEICDDPCRHDTVGDLDGSTEFHVEATAEEARLKELLNNWVAERIESYLPAFPETVTGLRSDFDAYRVNEALRDTRTQLELARELRELRQRIAALGDGSPVAQASPTGLEPGLWLAGWVVAAGIGGLWWASRRRRRSPVRARPAAV